MKKILILSIFLIMVLSGSSFGFLFPLNVQQANAQSSSSPCTRAAQTGSLIAVSSSSSLIMVTGRSFSETIESDPSETLSATICPPADIKLSFIYPHTISSSAWDNALDIVVGDSVPPGQYVVNITGTGASSSTPDTDSFVLWVVAPTARAPNPAPDFTIASTSTSATVQAGSTGSPGATISITYPQTLPSYYDGVFFDAYGLPDNVVANFSPGLVPPAPGSTASSTLTFDAYQDAIPGTYQITIVGHSAETVTNGMGGGVLAYFSHTLLTPISLTITSPATQQVGSQGGASSTSNSQQANNAQSNSPTNNQQTAGKNMPNSKLVIGVTDTSGYDNAHFNFPYGVAVDSAGNIYVADDSNNRVQIFDSSGTYKSTLGVTGASGNTPFSEPTGVAVDSAGNIYVADSYNNRVQIFDSSGTYKSTLGVTGASGSDNTHFNGPLGVAVDSTGNIYVADYDNQRVQIFDSSGTYKSTLGVTYQFGSDNAHFDYPGSVAVDSAGNIYVADFNNQRVQIFDSSGTYKSTLGVTGASGSDNTHFNGPLGVAVDSTGNIYVADSYNNRVQIFDSSGTYKSTLTGFNQPHGVAVDSAGNIYVVDTHNDRIQIFGPQGQSQQNGSTSQTIIPKWIKNNAGYWAGGQMDDRTFLSGIQYMVQNKIVVIPSTAPNSSPTIHSVPAWVKNDARFWSQGTIDDNTFAQAIQYLISEGIITP